VHRVQRARPELLRVPAEARVLQRQMPAVRLV
jgi:hypothetical protein